MKRIITLILALLMLGATMVACTGDGGTPSDTTAGDVTTGGSGTTGGDTTAAPDADKIPAAEEDCNLPDIAAATLEIIKGGKGTGFRIIYASEGYSASSSAEKNIYKAQADALSAAIKEKFGIKLSVAEDNSKYDDRNREILIGPTSRPQSDEANLFCNGAKGFVIKAHGRKLVINSYSPDKIAEAVTYFIENYVDKAGEDAFTFKSSDDYCSAATYNNAMSKIAGYSYKTYTIVVPENAKYSELRTARRIQSVIANRVGAVLDIVYDNDTAHNADFEILIGNTKKTSETSKNVGKLEYVLAMNGAKVELNAGSIFAMEYAAKEAETSLISKLNNASYNGGEIMRKNVESTLESKGTKTAGEKAGELRLLVHNVWGWNEDTAMGVWSNTPVRYNSVQQRNLMMAEFYLDLDADVIALQEYTEHLMRTTDHCNISPIMENAGYGQVYHSDTARNSATPIFYKKDKLELIESDVIDWRSGPYAGCGGDKFMTVAVFKQKSDQKIFAVISVHFDYRHPEGDQNRINMAKDTVTMADAIRTKYNGCPVFIGGDMNCTTSDLPFDEYIKAGYASVVNKAAETDKGCGNLGGPTWNEQKAMFITDYTGKGMGSSSSSIDHIVYKGSNVGFLKYDFLTDSVAGSISDHLPHVLDFNLN